MSSVEQVAVRRDERTGVEERVRFVGPPSRRRLVVTHLPAGTPRASVLICSPILIAQLRLQRTELLLARRLAARGIAVQRFDYLGTGNSDGDDLDLTLSGMCEDADLAIEALESAGGVPCQAIVGTRVGAIVAASCAREHDVRKLLLVEPISNPARFVREAVRSLKISDVAQADGAVGASDDVRRGLADGGWIDILGYRISAGLNDSLLARPLDEVVAPGPGSMLVVEMSIAQSGRAELRDFVQRRADDGWDVRHEILVSAENWWFPKEGPDLGPEFLALTSDWVLASVGVER